MTAFVYVGLAGTIILGVYPRPFIDWVVGATLMFSNLVGPTASVLPPTVLPFGG